MRLLISFFFFLWLFAFIQGRPNPVPNDELNEKEALEEYEKDKFNKPVRVKRHRRVRGPEDPEDQDILDELEDCQRFKGIRRRNRDIYPVRANIFQSFIDAAALNTEDESKDG